MAQKDLVPMNKRTKEEQKSLATLGGIKSGEARRRKKTMKQVMELMLSAKIPVEGVPEQLQAMGLEDEDLNVQTAIVYSQVVKAIKDGDTRSAEFCRDTVGEFIGCEEEKEIKEKLPIFIPAKDIGKAFVDLNRWIDDRKYTDLWLEGGRGSAKSSFWSEKVIEILENNPNMCAIAIRKVGNTLKDSVYSQLQWGIEKMSEVYPDISEHWICAKSPLEIKNKDTGQIIYFRGADDPVKIKSIKPPINKYIGLIIYEEFDQMNGMNEVRKIDQSAKRGGDDILTFRIYNTPKSNNHFVNKEKIIPKKDRIVHLSTYLDVPVEFLGQPFIDDAEYLKEINYKVYAHRTGTGNNAPSEPSDWHLHRPQRLGQ